MNKPIYVLLSILLSGGLLGFYWVYRISGNYIKCKNNEYSAIDNQLIKCRYYYIIITMIHLIYWPLLVFIVIIQDAKVPNEYLPIFTVVGVIEVILLLYIIVKIVVVLEMALTNTKPSYLVKIFETLLYFISIVKMQSQYNTYINSKK